MDKLEPGDIVWCSRESRTVKILARVEHTDSNEKLYINYFIKVAERPNDLSVFQLTQDILNNWKRAAYYYDKKDLILGYYYTWLPRDCFELLSKGTLEHEIEIIKQEIGI